MTAAVITCIAADCRRDPLPSTPDGTRFAMCADHTCRALSDAFGWHDRARTNTLPVLVVGGSPRPDFAVGAAPDAPQPARSLDHAAGATTAAVSG